jgi:hypothetical protein
MITLVTEAAIPGLTDRSADTAITQLEYVFIFILSYGADEILGLNTDLALNRAIPVSKRRAFS